MSSFFVRLKIKMMCLFREKKFLVLLLICLLYGVIAIPRIFAQPQAIKSVEILSEKLDYNKKEPGAFKINKSAEWISKGRAEITFDVETVLKRSTNYTDVLFVLDVSGSMAGEKLDKVKSDTSELITSLLSNEDNRAGLITFESTSEILLDFTNNKDLLLEKVSSLEPMNNTNYYQALSNVDKVLKNYEKKNDRDCVILFLTDGYPNEDIPNEEVQYSYLKNQYPFITINGIQYEMGTAILEPIKKISDNQFIANMKTLNNILFDASVVPITYDNFKISDYIDTNYFYVESSDDIEVSHGTFVFDKDKQRIDWVLDKFNSGDKAKMKIKANLKDEYVGKGGLYPTNEKEDITSKIDEDEEDIISSKTPILSDLYEVIYDGNAPSNCKVVGVPDSQKYSPFDTVAVDSVVPVCQGYQFKGWTINDSSVTKINKDYFIMPSNDVKIVAKWSKLDVKKSMEGSIQERLTLYKQVQADVNDSTKYAKEYTGNKSTFNGKEKVYYYYGEAKNNNVIFGNYCWKIVRTTDTGGVKMIYDGVPSEDGECKNSGTASALTKEQMGLDSSTVAFKRYPADVPAYLGYMYNKVYDVDYFSSSEKSQTINSGADSIVVSSQIIDNGDETVTLTSPIEVSSDEWTTDYEKYSSYYTCGNSNLTCSKNIMRHITNTSNNSYSYVVVSKIYKYGNSVKYENGKYTLIDIVNIDNPTESDLINNHHYSCFSDTDTCSEVNYIYYQSYYIKLTLGDTIEDALKKMLSADDVNEKSSDIKQAIDYWYLNNMTNYTTYLEDTVWCNDRSIDSLGGWNPNGGSISAEIEFNPINYSDLICPNMSDRFTVSDENGNGALTYPVGLLTRQENGLAYRGYNTSPFASGSSFWGMSPYSFDRASALFYTDRDGFYNVVIGATFPSSVRPVISLKPGIGYTSGNGSSETPYIIEVTQ